MKTSVTGLLALLAGAYVIHAQGTVSLGNYAVLNQYIYVSYRLPSGISVPLGGNGAGEPAPTLSNYALETGNGSDWTVALYGALGNNASQNSMVELTTGLNTGPFVTATFETGNPLIDVIPGTWFTSLFGTISGAAGNGSAASVQLAAWYNDGGTILSLAAAQADGVPWGRSAIVNTLTGGPNLDAPPSVATDLPTIPNFTILSFGVSQVPEPTSVALGVIGASVFVVHLRRKKWQSFIL